MEQKIIQPLTLVIFGSTGDLSRKKLFPALRRLIELKMLPECVNILGASTRALDDEGFRSYIKESLSKTDAGSAEKSNYTKQLLARTHFTQINFEEASGFLRLKNKLAEIEKACGTKHGKIFYLATPPEHFRPIIEHIGSSGLNAHSEGEPFSPRILVEKPFGSDYDSARALNDLIDNYFSEEDVYRIDHYLGKETVQNILFFRFANGIYEPIWDRRYIDHMQITVAENIGIEERGKYYERAGALRDMVQNHILQLLALVCMEPPTNLESVNIRSRKMDLIESIRPMEREDVIKHTVRGQYGEGASGSVHTLPYRMEKHVSPESNVETYAAVKLFIDNWRWSGVPFFIRTGKKLEKRVTEVAIRFRSAPQCLFTKSMKELPKNNVLIIKIQPEEGIRFDFNIKYPGSSNNTDLVKMDFSYKDAYGLELPDAYERLLHDCMIGDTTLFHHRRGVEASWKFIDGITNVWKELPAPKFPNYTPGSWGPDEADRLMDRYGRKWRTP